MEVFPELANDTQGSVEQARKLWQEIDKPNLMIKIPATPAGIPAIEQLISEGINVNVTLIFAVEMYRQVMDAYLKGLERRSGDLTGIASVASFFVSRVDSAVDKQLEALAHDKPDVAKLAGKAAVANAKVAYQAFKETFDGQRFASLKARGAAVQRPLWASTGTKNPTYSDVLYVEELIGRDTVNTMPPATVEAFKDHGEVEATIEQDLAGAKQALAAIEAAGVSMASVTKDLLDEGVKLFVDAFDTLMSVIDAKREALRDNIAGREQASIGDLQAAVDKRLAALAKADAVRKVWQKDASFWGVDKDSDAGRALKQRMGWLNVTDLMLDHAEDLERFAQHVKASGVKRAIFCGSAGINPAVDALAQAFGGQPGWPEMSAMHASDVAKLPSLDAATLIIHAGKSATVPFQKAAHEHLWGLRPHGDQYVLVTDASTELPQMAAAHKFRRAFLDPGDIAGEYGAMSYLGLVAAAVAGCDVTRLLNRAEHVVHDCVPLIQPADNAGAWFGAVLAEASLAGRRKITVITPPGISKFGAWAAQIATRAGLESEAVTSVSAASGNDRLYVCERLGHELDGAVEALRKAGQPVVTFTLRDKFDLGEELFRWQFGVAVAAGILGVNAFAPPATH